MAPQYTTRDLVYYSGLFVGLGVTYTMLPRVGVSNRFLIFVLALLVGVGCGWLAERVFKAASDD
jgi:hypothetical protein